MREIKFRAWDKIGKIMIPVSRLDFPLSEKREILMQFTGLLDKNGKEIYEGDIVSWNDKKARVIFSNGKFTADIHGKFEVTNWNSCEIIGNIYENPNLLLK